MSSIQFTLFQFKNLLIYIIRSLPAYLAGGSEQPANHSGINVGCVLQSGYCNYMSKAVLEGVEAGYTTIYV
jgi:hypothetical protein